MCTALPCDGLSDKTVHTWTGLVRDYLNPMESHPMKAATTGVGFSRWLVENNRNGKVRDGENMCSHLSIVTDEEERGACLLRVIGSKERYTQ